MHPWLSKHCGSAQSTRPLPSLSILSLQKYFSDLSPSKQQDRYVPSEVGQLRGFGTGPRETDESRRVSNPMTKTQDETIRHPNKNKKASMGIRVVRCHSSYQLPEVRLHALWALHLGSFCVTSFRKYGTGRSDPSTTDSRTTHRSATARTISVRASNFMVLVSSRGVRG
jgi:hypothetical protein